MYERIEIFFHTDNTPCPVGWQKIWTGCYLFVKTKVTWVVARINCLILGGDLVIPKSALQCYLLSSRAAFLGMHIPWIGIFRFVSYSFSLLIVYWRTMNAVLAYYLKFENVSRLQM